MTALGLLLALLASSLGITMPVTPQKQTDEPYPCMNCACGCFDAETCWRSCCCYTNAEKLAWAREHRVVPPDFVVAAAAREACSQRKTASCCHSTKGCCQQVVQNDERPMVWSKSLKTSKRAATAIVLWQALRCQGLTSSLTHLPPTIVPPAPEFTEPCEGLTERVALVEESFSGQLPPPDLPPPKNAA